MSAVVVKGGGGQGSKGFARAPKGEQQVVCVDVEDGIRRKIGQWGVKDRVALWFMTEYTDDEDKPILLREEFTASLHENARLSKFLEDWRGKPFTDEERSGFDLERLIGVNASAFVVHRTHKGKKYSNIEAITPPNPEKEKLTVPDFYVRRKDREPRQPDPPPPTEDDYSDVAEEDWDEDWSPPDEDELVF